MVRPWLDRLRFIKRARLESLILELEEVLSAYRTWMPSQSPPPEPVPALPEGSEERFDWDALVAQVKRHAGTPVHRIGEAAGHVALGVGRRSKEAVSFTREKARRLGDRPTPDDDDHEE